MAGPASSDGNNSLSRLLKINYEWYRWVQSKYVFHEKKKLISNKKNKLVFIVLPKPIFKNWRTLLWKVGLSMGK